MPPVIQDFLLGLAIWTVGSCLLFGWGCVQDQRRLRLAIRRRLERVTPVHSSLSPQMVANPVSRRAPRVIE